MANGSATCNSAASIAAAPAAVLQDRLVVLLVAHL